MDKTLYDHLEKKANWEQQRLVPIVGHWYKISYEQDGSRASRSLRLSFRLCVKIADHEGANVYMSGIDLTSNELTTTIGVYPDEVRYAEWPVTNEFHHFCLVMLYCQLGDNPLDINIYNDFKLYVLMETILLPKVFSAKTAKEAIEGARKAVEQGTRARLNYRPYGQFNAGIENQTKREKVREAFEWLLQKFNESKY